LKAEKLKVSSFTVYYGRGRIRELSNFDLAILSPLLDSREVSALNSLGTITISYLNLTLLGGWEPWASKVREAMFLPGKAVINPENPEWRKTILEAVGYINRKGFQGFFIDSMDMVDLYPEMAEPLVSLVAEIRRRNPGCPLIVNRGFSILQKLTPHINGLVFDGFATYYNPSTLQYEKWRNSDLEWMLETCGRLRRLQETLGIKVLALAYANPRDRRFPEYREYVSKLARRFGFTYYIAERDFLTVTPRRMLEA